MGQVRLGAAKHMCLCNNKGWAQIDGVCAAGQEYAGCKFDLAVCGVLVL